jgi:hypothetical protein
VLQAVKDRDIPLLQKLLIKGGKSGKTSKFINDSILILIKKKYTRPQKSINVRFFREKAHQNISNCKHIQNIPHKYFKNIT